MIVNEEGILEFLSQTKDALDSYINLRNTKILSVAFTKDEYDDFLSLLFHLQMYERELNELIETEDLKDELVLCLAELLIFDIIEVCRELHDDYGEEAQLKVRYGELDEAKIAVIRLLKGFHRPLVADWQTLDEVATDAKLFITIETKGDYAYFKSHETQKDAYLYAISHGIAKDQVFNRLLI